jgi:hypothetical protein
MELVTELLKISLPALLVLGAMYLSIRNLLRHQIDQKQLDLRASYAGTLLPTRLQAYERMTLFLERITPNQLLLRLQDQAFSARELQQILLLNVRQEYEHNLSQQLYMSSQVWQQISSARESTVVLINSAAQELPADAPALDLAKKMFELVMAQGELPTEQALLALKIEAADTFGM